MYDTQITPHFSLAEMASHDTVDDGQDTPGDVYHNLTDLCQHLLEPLRAEVGPMVVLSGYRSVAHNEAVGGAPGSKHIYGLAADIEADDEAQIRIAAAATHMARCGGIGIYPGQGLVHLDIRPRRPDGTITIWERLHGAYQQPGPETRAKLASAGATDLEP